MKVKKENILLYLLLGIGIILTLLYIFRTSTIMLNTDYVITDVITHEQKLTGQFILKDWYYSNESFTKSISIPTYVLSFVIKNNLLLRQVCVLITSIIFFILLYIYGKKYLEKRERLILLAIFASGISYSVLDYFYAFNTYLTVVINSLMLFFLYYKAFEEKEKNKLYLVLSVIFTFLFSMGSLRYICAVIIPFVFTELILLFKKNKNEILNKVIKIIGIILTLIIGILIYKLLFTNHKFSISIYNKIDFNIIKSNFMSVVDSIFNFFGFDNMNNIYQKRLGNWFYVNEHKEFSIYSIRNISYILKFLAFFVFIIVSPIALFKKYKQNDKKINILLIFNTVSWVCNIFAYVIIKNYQHNYGSMHYFMFNIVISIVLGLYLLSNHIKNKNIKMIVYLFLIVYILANIYTTSVTIIENNNRRPIQREIAKILMKNDLTFGYGDYYDSLIINFFSGYEVDIVPINYFYNNKHILKNSKISIHSKNYNKGKMFILYNPNFTEFNSYLLTGYQPDKTIHYKKYRIDIFNINPFTRRIKYEK